VTTRRGKQFNSMVYSRIDPFNAARRDDVLLHESDAGELGIAEGEAIVVYNRNGTMYGRAKFAEIKPGNVEVFWPEGNVLFPVGVYEPHAGIPEYNGAVIIEKAETFFAFKDTRYAERRIAELDIGTE
ncbi:MAG: formate dehydrogenase alpha chain, partial [Paenibacillus sp.]|nr:formate dehydrogenase alpha chain [Paenibacillus sp.]